AAAGAVHAGVQPLPPAQGAVRAQHHARRLRGVRQLPARGHSVRVAGVPAPRAQAPTQRVGQQPQPRQPAAGQPDAGVREPGQRPAPTDKCRVAGQPAQHNNSNRSCRCRRRCWQRVQRQRGRGHCARRRELGRRIAAAGGAHAARRAPQRAALRAAEPRVAADPAGAQLARAGGAVHGDGGRGAARGGAGVLRVLLRVLPDPAPVVAAAQGGVGHAVAAARGLAARHNVDVCGAQARVRDRRRCTVFAAGNCHHHPARGAERGRGVRVPARVHRGVGRARLCVLRHAQKRRHQPADAAQLAPGRPLRRAHRRKLVGRVGRGRDQAPRLLDQLQGRQPPLEHRRPPARHRRGAGLRARALLRRRVGRAQPRAPGRPLLRGAPRRAAPERPVD
ncbi:hypothetical protein IWQ56_006047, partial [Coemansia nantahalensis]